MKYGYQVDPISFGGETASDTTTEEEGSGPPVQLQVSQCTPVEPSNSDIEEYYRTIDRHIAEFYENDWKWPVKQARMTVVVASSPYMTICIWSSL